MKRHFVVGALAVLTSVTLFNPALFAEPSPVGESVVTVAKPFTYMVRKGENLTRIAGRFNVTLEDLLVKNPRKNPDLLFVGEKLEIPQTYHAVQVPKEELTPDDLVLVGSAVLEAERRVTEEKITQATDLTTYARSYNILFLGVIVALLIFILYPLFGRSATAEMPSVASAELTFENKTAVEIAELLKTARGHALDNVLKIPVAKDERGNPVLLRNVSDFVAKRVFLLNVPVNQWEEAVKQAEIARKAAQIPTQNVY